MDIDVRLAAAKAKMEDTLKIYSGKTMEIVIGNSSYKRDILAESVYSLKDVAENLYSIVMQIKKDDALSKCNKLMDEMNVLKQSLPEIIRNTVASTIKPISEAVSPIPLNVEDKQRHVIMVQDKTLNVKFDETSWSTVVKGTLKEKLKSIPIDRSLVTKKGQGCLFFPNKQAQEKAKSALEPHYEITSTSRPQKTVMPKIKVFDVDTEVHQNKSELRQAILDKNPDIANMVSKDDDLSIILLDTSRRYAIIKVLPNIRKLMIKQGKIFLGMCSVKVRNHFQPLQCYACQKHGHKQGSPDCEHNNKDTNTCLYCSGDHFSRNCPVKQDPTKHKCANCCKSDKLEYNQHASHKSTSFQCPFVIKETNSLIQRTTGITEIEAKKLKISIS